VDGDGNKKVSLQGSLLSPLAHRVQSVSPHTTPKHTTSHTHTRASPGQSATPVNPRNATSSAQPNIPRSHLLLCCISCMAYEIS
jgi:hypothetical protein